LYLNNEATNAKNRQENKANSELARQEYPNNKIMYGTITRNKEEIVASAMATVYPQMELAYDLLG